jgi:hypothetical protein
VLSEMVSKRSLVRQHPEAIATRGELDASAPVGVRRLIRTCRRTGITDSSEAVIRLDSSASSTADATPDAAAGD